MAVAAIPAIEEDWQRLCNGGMVARVQADLAMLQKWNVEKGQDVDVVVDDFKRVFSIPSRSYALRDLVSFDATVKTSTSSQPRET